LFKNGVFELSLSVPSENKRDQRSIEETLNDIRKRKRLRPGDIENEDEQG